MLPITFHIQSTHIRGTQRWGQTHVTNLVVFDKNGGLLPITYHIQSTHIRGAQRWGQTHVTNLVVFDKSPVLLPMTYHIQLVWGQIDVTKFAVFG